jgi:hypothetical protein
MVPFGIVFLFVCLVSLDITTDAKKFTNGDDEMGRQKMPFCPAFIVGPGEVSYSINIYYV